MKARTFIALAAVTVLAVAAVVFIRPPVPAAVSGAGEKLFADLPARIEGAATLIVRGAHDTVTLERGERGWTVRERGGYPASFEKIRTAVISLMELEKAEPKTARAEGFARLGVADIGDAAATGREISILDAAGKPLARVIAGKTVHGIGGESSVFVRIPGEDQAWLARGRIDAGAAPRDWLDRRLLDIPAGEIKRLHVVRADGSTLTVVRDGPNSPLLKLEDLPKGTRLKRPEGLEAMIGAFSPLDIEDVRPAADIAGAASRARIELATFGGETLSANLVERGAERWLRFPVPAAGGAAEPKPADWAFQVPGWKVDPLLKPLADLVEADGGRAPAAPR